MFWRKRVSGENDDKSTSDTVRKAVEDHKSSSAKLNRALEGLERALHEAARKKGVENG